jgi:outer membrane protein assembly factor BamA
MMQLTVKPGAPPSALIPYRINKVFIYPSYSELTSDTLVHDTLKYEDYNIIGNSAYINPSLLKRSVFLGKGDLYSYENHTLTLKMMSELGLFRFTNIRFEQTPNTRGLLNTYIYLTPREKRYLRAEFGVENKSTDFTGPLLKTSLTNRNVFGGAENFSLNADLGIESQFSAIPSTYLGKFSYKANIHASYEVPGFLTPFTFSKHNYKYLPRTSADLGISFLKRIEYYSMNSVNADFGYKWKETEGKTHDLNLISLNFQHVAKSTPQFDTILFNNSLLARSYEDQFLFGANYNYIFSTQNQLRRRTLIYFNGNIDLGGNLLGLTQSLIEGRKPTVDSPLKILGTKYAQYSRFLADFRTHTKVLYTNTLATRLVIGVGIPYGNSDALPYIKQFFAGGSNSIRAFPARSIGPGSFNPNQESGAVFVDQTGDIRLEANMELRFPIAGSFKAAIFADAGNVWLYNYDPKRPGGQFSFNRFLRQSALGTGLGIRYVSSFLVIRLDAGYPLYIPYLQPAADRWVFNTPSENLKGFPTLNFAIGYPF